MTPRNAHERRGTRGSTQGSTGSGERETVPAETGSGTLRGTVVRLVGMVAGSLRGAAAEAPEVVDLDRPPRSRAEVAMRRSDVEESPRGRRAGRTAAPPALPRPDAPAGTHVPLPDGIRLTAWATGEGHGVTLIIRNPHPARSLAGAAWRSAFTADGSASPVLRITVHGVPYAWQPSAEKGAFPEDVELSCRVQGEGPVPGLPEAGQPVEVTLREGRPPATKTLWTPLR
ncbi:hypothetical protein ACFV3E_26270 [Streptomyces sp. NPDC059718]